MARKSAVRRLNELEEQLDKIGVDSGEIIPDDLYIEDIPPELILSVVFEIRDQLKLFVEAWNGENQEG